MKSFIIIRSNALKVLRGVVVTFICFGAWEIGAITVDNSYFLPRVGETISALFGLIVMPIFLEAVAISLLRVLIGLTAGILAGVILALSSYYFKLSNSLISPIISIMKATPIATIILILWFMLTDAELSIFVVFLMVTPIVWQNVYDGFGYIPKELDEVCIIYELTFKKKVRLLIFPTLVKYLIPAVITSIGLAWKAEIAAEIMTYSNIGRSIQDFKTLFYDTASVFAWALVIIFFSLILEGVTKYFLRRIKT